MCLQLHFTICRLAGLPDAACRDDAIPGVPPVDGIDFRAAFQSVNVSRPLSQGTGASAGTQEIVLSSNGGPSGDQELGNLTGAYIDFCLTNGGPWKFVRNTSTVLKNAGSPIGSGYWTGALWPVGNNHGIGAVGLEPDVGCPPGGCLFNLRLDRTEHREFSDEQPELKAAMAKRMAELIATRFQTSTAYTGGYDNCSSDAAIVSANRGFTGPCCTKGAAWSSDIACLSQTFERFSVADYRGTWTCDAGQQALTANDDAASDGAAIGFARLQGIQQPPPGSGGAGFKLGVGIKLTASNDSASCAYRYGGVVIGMGSKEGAAGSDFRDEFGGYTVTLTPPDCTGEEAKLTVGRHDVGPGHSNPTFSALGSHKLAGTATGEWQQLLVAANATHISVGIDGVGARMLEVALLPDRPIGCGQSITADRLAATEPWEHANVVRDACSVGVYMHRATTSWRALNFAEPDAK